MQSRKKKEDPLGARKTDKLICLKSLPTSFRSLYLDFPKFDDYGNNIKISQISMTYTCKRYIYAVGHRLCIFLPCSLYSPTSTNSIRKHFGVLITFSRLKWLL